MRSKWIEVIFGAVVGWIGYAVLFNHWNRTDRVSNRNGQKESMIQLDGAANGIKANQSKELKRELESKELERELKRVAVNISGVSIICAIISITRRSDHLRAINQTYGKRCDRLIFYSSSEINDFNVVVLPAQIGKWTFLVAVLAHLARVIKATSDQESWLLLLDDTTYSIMENLRYYLSINPVQFAGRRVNDQWFFWSQSSPTLDPNSGIVIKWTLIRIILSHISTNPFCKPDDRSLEDGLSECIGSMLNIEPVDGVDTLNGGHRFLPENPYYLFDGVEGSWLWFLGSLFQWEDPGKCCSDLAITFGSLKASDFYTFEYLIYHLRPQGIDFSH